MPPLTDYSFLLESARQVVAAALAETGVSSGVHASTRKFDGTLVTQTDQALNRRIEQLLHSTYPDHAVLGEERTTRYAPQAAFTWVVDPLDGTTNFARGLPIWGMSLALLEQGVPVVGLLHFPLLREEFCATAGGGAFAHDLPIHTAPETQPDDEHFIMCCTRTPRFFSLSTPLKARILGSAAYHLAKVADGTALAAIEATPKLWDLAAALLILQEAGGVYKPLDGGPPVFPLPSTPADYRTRAFPLLAAANPTLLERVRVQVHFEQL